ncbi:MAG: DUF2071 domain-containing protein [Gemmatimonadaceae bacterium]|nr:DUF2071 domain-containing protein [Gemmatimonadaceae bacterium]
MVAHFDRVVALSFAFPESVVRPLVPRALSLDLFDGWAFVTVAMVWTRALRPAGVPAALGRDFFLAGYRVFTRFQEPGGRRLRGLRILRSATDARLMVLLGNLFTGYRYTHVAVQRVDTPTQLDVTTRDRHGAVTLAVGLDLTPGEAPLPAGSPFPDWTTARRFAGPLPFTFSPEGDDAIVVVEGSRAHWIPRPVAVTAWRVALFDEAPFAGERPRLANAFMVEDVAYRWARGRVVPVEDATA